MVCVPESNYLAPNVLEPEGSSVHWSPHLLLKELNISMVIVRWASKPIFFSKCKMSSKRLIVLITHDSGSCVIFQMMMLGQSQYMVLF
jgi:hypothetical protein